MLNNEEFDQWFSSFRHRMIAEVSDYLSVDTSFGKEADAFPFLQKLLAEYGFDVLQESFPLSISKHPAYTESDITLCNSNLRATWKPSSAQAESVLFNSHVDVVPAEGENKALFSPHFDDQYIYGRGACDTKGNLFLLLGALAYIKKSRRHPKYKILLDLVSGEEVGGNGTLSTIMRGVNVKFAVVFEPTDLLLHRGHRGCLTCQLDITGKAVHMGGDDHGVSAIKAATMIIAEIEALEAELLISAKLDPAFVIWDRPLQINIGKIAGGEWPGSVPEKCTLTMNVGFLPGRSINDVEKLIKARVSAAVGELQDVSVVYDFYAGLRNNAYIIPADDQYLTSLNSSIAMAGDLSVPADVYGWRVSCDARHYVHEAGVDAVVFGAGSLKDAHSSHEKISIDQMRIGIKALVLFLSDAAS